MDRPHFFSNSPPDVSTSAAVSTSTSPCASPVTDCQDPLSTVVVTSPPPSSNSSILPAGVPGPADAIAIHHTTERQTLPHPLPHPTGNSLASPQSLPESHLQPQVQPQTQPQKLPPSRPRAVSHARTLSSASRTPSSSKKGSYAEPGTAHIHAHRSSVSLNPNQQPALKDIQPSWLASPEPDFAPPDHVEEESDTPRIRPKATQSDSECPPLPEPALTARSSFPDLASRRLSNNSVYSLASARGAPTSNSSTNGSDQGTNQRPVSGLMSSGKNPKAGQSEAGLSNVTVTTSSNGPTSHVPLGQHQLAPRDQPPQSLDLVGRTQRAEASPRHQPDRSRSRAKRRFSGSTGNSSHSPGSDRPSYSRETREREDVKPAPGGVIGVCALDVKARSKPSRNILNRLIANREFDVVVFGDKVILDEEVENWPICDYLISFYSDGFPLEKAIAYVKARKPFCVNDVPMQQILWDRRVCLRLLDKIQVRTPKRLEVSRDGGPKVLTPDMAKYMYDISGIQLEPNDLEGATAPRKVELLDGGDVLSVDGALLKKPFVEKPMSGEDHNIVIYFPQSAGGGARKLFRKIGNKSSDYIADLNTPRAISEPGSSYLYESFMQVDNAEDIKAYTVGSQYCHAETRKSPVVDGVVRRNTHGKELRYITSLNPEEKDIASKISRSFGQRVCGFDLLRASGKSYVIDVNGWSFVKDNDDYYDQSAKILRECFIKAKAQKEGVVPSLPSPGPMDIDPLLLAPKSAKDRDTQGTNAAASVSTATLLAEESQYSEPASQILGGPPSPVATSGTHAAGQSLAGTPFLPPPSSEFPPPGSHSAPSSIKTSASIPPAAASSMPETEEADQAPPPPKHSWKLKGVVSVIRHADRTPKQKYKFTFHTEPFIELLRGHQEEVLLIGEPALASVIQAVDTAFQAGIEDQSRLKSLRNVLVKKGSWAGTKVQIKPMFRKKKTADSPTAEEMPQLTENIQTFPQSNVEKPTDSEPYEPHGPPKRHDSLSEVTMSKFTAAEESLVLDKLQLIVKWGGEPTHSARYQAQELGENMRNDFMLLNRDIVDEVHVFSSSERRVTTSAQIWAASFLGKKDIPEDFITIRKDLLDDSNAAKDETDKVKKKLKGLLREGNERPPEFAWPENTPEPSEVQTRVVQLMKFHRRVMNHNYTKLYSGAASSLSAVSNPSSERLTGEGSHTSSSSALSTANAVTNIQSRWCSGEDAELFRERWEKLFSEFCDGEKVDPSKISELYDTMKFDALHNRQFLEWVFTPPWSMLEEEYGIKETKEKDGEDAKNPEESRERHQNVNAEEAEGRGASVRKLFRRRSFLNGLRGIGEEATGEQYFRLYKGTSQNTTKTSPRNEPLQDLYRLAKVLFDFICPQEYGISDSEKLEIGLLTSLPLLKEIVQDLEEMQASNDAKSFFYFTKESHIYTLLNCIVEGGIETKIKRSAIPELDYLSQISFELYESEMKPSPERTADEPSFAYSIRITVSPGCHVVDPLHVQLDSRHCIGCAPRRSLTSHGDWLQVIKTLRAKFNQVKLPKSFLAVNLSDAFTFEDHEKQTLDSEGLEMKSVPPKDILSGGDLPLDTAMLDAGAASELKPAE